MRKDSTFPLPPPPLQQNIEMILIHFIQNDLFSKKGIYLIDEIQYF